MIGPVQHCSVPCRVLSSGCGALLKSTHVHFAFINMQPFEHVVYLLLPCKPLQFCAIEHNFLSIYTNSMCCVVSINVKCKLLLEVQVANCIKRDTEMTPQRYSDSAAHSLITHNGRVSSVHPNGWTNPQSLIVTASLKFTSFMIIVPNLRMISMSDLESSVQCSVSRGKTDTDSQP